MTNPLITPPMLDQDIDLPHPPAESDAEFQEMLESGIQELRRRETGHEAQQDVWIMEVSDEVERLLLACGDLGEIWTYIFSAKQSRWAEAEDILLEIAPAGMLISYLGYSKYPWPEALMAIEERFDPEAIGDVASLALNPEVLPNDLRGRLCTRMENEGISTRNTWKNLVV